jgi:tetratricopeptide (TPR) repeat protein
MDKPSVLASSLNWMGNWFTNAEMPLKAVTYHQEALNISEALGDKQDLAQTLDLLGIANGLEGVLTDSQEYFDRAIALFRELYDIPNLVSSLLGRGNIGGAVYYSGTVVAKVKSSEARLDFEEALQIAREINLPASEAWGCWSLGLLYIVQGEFGHAVDIIESGHRIASEIGHREWIAGNRHVLGILYSELFAPDLAEEQQKIVLEIGEAMRSQHWIPLATDVLATAYHILGDLTQAQICLETVISPQIPMDTLH